MKAAIIVEAIGVPGTLASTSLVGTLAEGLTHAGVETRIIGLGLDQSQWRPDAVEYPDVTAPLLDTPIGGWADAVDASSMGLDLCPDRENGWAWRRQLALQRELEALAAGDHDCVAMVYPRSYPLLRVTVSVCERLGWRLLVFATEALTDEQINPESREDYIRLVVGAADAVWAVSEHLAEFWRRQGVSEERIAVNPPVVRSSFFSVEPHARRACAAVYIGNLAHREIDYLLEIASRVRVELPSFTLSIFGDATPARIRQLACAVDDAALAGTVMLQPPVPHKELPALLGSADVLLLPRAQGEFSQAGFPHKLGEYLSSGRPVIVSAVGEIPRYLADRVQAFLVNPDDCEAFARVVVEVLRNEVLADAVGERGRAAAASFARGDQVADVLKTRLESLPSRPAVGGRRSWVRARQHALVYVFRANLVPWLKRVGVRILRAMHLKPPPPEGEERGRQ